ncbi:MAG: late competence development ComFB family protein [Desulfohalobiaceae bacterium]|nr:late competence development ComFB family protein [Desulfohalobiaceae bacterium]
MTGNNILKTKRSFRGIDLNRIRNRNEVRVINQLPDILKEYPDFEPHIINIQDVYALTLNLLPPRYIQQLSIVLQEPVSDEQIREALRKAIEKVRVHPIK